MSGIYCTYSLFSGLEFENPKLLGNLPRQYNCMTLQLEPCSTIPRFISCNYWDHDLMNYQKSHVLILLPSAPNHHDGGMLARATVLKCIFCMARQLGVGASSRTELCQNCQDSPIEIQN